MGDTTVSKISTSSQRAARYNIASAALIYHSNYWSFEPLAHSCKSTSYASCRQSKRPREGEAIAEWLERWSFDRFITLATNDVMLADERGLVRLKQLLRAWDARINRKVVGPKWTERRDERIWSFFFLEKPAANPHWHGLVQFAPTWPDRDYAKKYAARFDEWAPIYWKELIPSGTVDIQAITNPHRVNDYVVKSLGHQVSYSNFVVPDDF